MEKKILGKNIIVHCTHGVNRTGFMICRYMIENMDMTTDEAVASKHIEFSLILNERKSFKFKNLSIPIGFSTSRGHTMERYIDELRAIEMSL